MPDAHSQAARPRARGRLAERPWADWIAALAAALTLVGGASWAAVQAVMQTGQNSTDIRELKGKVEPLDARLTRIETKIDDLTAFERRRRAEPGRE